MPEEVLWTAPEAGLPTFAELGLPGPVLRALEAEGFVEPRPIQAATLPETLRGQDLLGRGQTGSGKTLAFGLALVARLAGGRAQARRPRGLVLVPTRELAQQVVDAVEPFAKALHLRQAVVVGGLSMNRQIDTLARGVDLLVATPGRLTDHLGEGTCDLSAVEITAIDEADRMSDMGFLPQVRRILDRTPADGQRLLFSATLDNEVATLVERYLHDPVTRAVASAAAPVETMDHHLLLVERADKNRIVHEIAAREGRTIFFVRTKHGADRAVKQLRREGVQASALHGGKAQNARNRAIDAFKDGSIPVLVATDVAARGIHVDDVSLVVHVDPPGDPKDYLHRAGRTARGGESGVVVTLVTADERRDVDTLMRQAGVRPEVVTAAPGSASLVQVTGARRPSGIPVEAPKPPQQQPAAGSGRRRRGSGQGEQRGRGHRGQQTPSDGRSRGEGVGGRRSGGRRGGRGGSPRTAA
ncbi:DEAD/DEAH box helicase [Pseudonocardia sp. RS010]|uniref:DEAD/DEAH box helicase n=1 Tax=Pseudonocardia sp. RS010 TaxID=3385979 RepID=UPI0039A27618